MNFISIKKSIIIYNIKMGGKKSKMVFEPSYSAMLNDETILYP